MSVDELIKELEALKAKHGNLSVVIYDNDTDWLIPILNVRFYEAEPDGGILDDQISIKAESYSKFLNK